MNHDTWKKLQFAAVAGAACLLTMAPGAMAQSGTGGTQPSTTDQNSTTGERDKSMGRHNQSMGERGAKQGDVSRIRRAQEALKSEGHDPGPVDGVMGPKTQEALRQYQKDQNLRQTGRLDQETMSKLGV